MITEIKLKEGVSYLIRSNKTSEAPIHRVFVKRVTEECYNLIWNDINNTYELKSALLKNYDVIEELLPKPHELRQKDGSCNCMLQQEEGFFKSFFVFSQKRIRVRCGGTYVYD